VTGNFKGGEKKKKLRPTIYVPSTAPIQGGRFCRELHIVGLLESLLGKKEREKRQKTVGAAVPPAFLLRDSPKEKKRKKWLFPGPQTASFQ